MEDSRVGHQELLVVRSNKEGVKRYVDKYDVYQRYKN